jgi:hypothetical protein
MQRNLNNSNVFLCHAMQSAKDLGFEVQHALLASGNLLGLTPHDFLCPICKSEKTVSLTCGTIQPILFLPLGARLQMDFGFYKTASICGFTCFLVIIEARSTNCGAYLRRSKHLPIKIMPVAHSNGSLCPQFLCHNCVY